MATWYDTAASILAEVKACIDDCGYGIYVSQGRPTADCNSITAWPSISAGLPVRLGRCDTYRAEEFKVTMTRCCEGIDAQVKQAFDPSREDNEARCFLEDVDIVDRCLVCAVPGVLKDQRIDCEENPVRALVFDQSREGECYTAEWTIAYERAISCEC